MRASHSDASAVARPASTIRGVDARLLRRLAYASSSVPTFFRGSSVPTNNTHPSGGTFGSRPSVRHDGAPGGQT